MKSFVEYIYGKLVGDKGYIGKDLFSKLFIVNLIGGIAAYCLYPKKPMINLERVYDNQLTLF